MGVITVTDVDYGHIFGPFPSHVTPADPAYLIGMLTNDKKPEGLMLKMDPACRREGLRSVDWLPYIHSARDSDEQNMEAYVKEGQVYFRALRIIRAGEEILVWYSKDFAQLLNIPELPRLNNKDGEHYICPRCGDTFEFPYSLRAHIKFKCSYTLSEISPNRPFLPAEENGFSPSSNAKLFRYKSFGLLDHSKVKPSTETRESSAKDVQNGLDFSRTGIGSDFGKPVCGLDFSKRGDRMDILKAESSSKKEPASVINPDNVSDLSKSQNGSDFPKPLPRYAESRGSVSPPSLPGKRPSSDCSPFRHTSPPKVARVMEPKMELLSPGKGETNRLLFRPGHKLAPETAAKDSHSDVASAFRKVERSLTPETDRPGSGSSLRAEREDSSSLSPVISNSNNNSSSSSGGGVGMSMPASSLPPSVHGAPLSSMSRLSGPASSVAAGLPAMPGPLMGLYMPRLPMVSAPLNLPPGPGAGPIHPVSAHHPAFAAADQIPPGLLEMCRATIPSIGPLTESFANVRNGDPSALSELAASKPGVFMARGERPGTHSAVGLGTVPFLKSNNPMVEKILQSTSPTLMTSPMSAVSLSQNWCAKCNATFRMTSDLVYHMRSHHKREFDPMKRKREEKLKCTICNESFRERHHLTRHMSSHA